jgi:hypothetical protein
VEARPFTAPSCHDEDCFRYYTNGGVAAGKFIISETLLEQPGANVAGSLTVTLNRTMNFKGKKRLSACGKLIKLFNYSRCRIRSNGNG